MAAAKAKAAAGVAAPAAPQKATSKRAARPKAEALVQVDGLDNQKKTALMLAAERGNLETTKLLVSQGLDLNARDSDTEATALLLAAAQGNLNVVEYLCSLDGCDSSAKNKLGMNALHLAAGQGHVEVAATLLGQVGINTQDNDGNTPLLQAAQNGQCEVIKMLSMKEECDVGLPNKAGETALHKVAANGTVETAALLLCKGAKLDARGKKKRTPLLEASFHGNLEVVKCVLAQDACDPSATDVDDNMALHLAAEKGHIEVADFLVFKGADVNAKNKRKQTPILQAAEAGHAEVSRLLLQANKTTSPFGASSETDAEGVHIDTPLRLASRTNHHKYVEALVEAKGFADLEVQGQWGGTALHWAAYNGHTDLVQCLLANEANIDVVAPGWCDRTPLHLATDAGHLEIVLALLSAKCNTSQRDSGGNTALTIAIGNDKSALTSTIADWEVFALGP